MVNLLDALDRLVPSDCLGSSEPEVVRRARLVVYLSAICFVAASLYAVVYVALAMPIAASGTFVATVAAVVVVAGFRRDQDLDRSAHRVASIPLLALVLVVAGTGGIASPATAWLLLCPVIAAMVGGRFAGLAWLGVVMVVVAGFTGLELAGLTPANELPNESLVLFYQAVVPTGLAAALFAVVWSYEISKDDAFGRLSAARDAARDAHEAARMVLDTVDEGLFLVRPDGTLESEQSAATRALLPQQLSGGKLWDLFGGDELTATRGWLELGWGMLIDGVMPWEVAVAQLPSPVQVAGRHLSLSFEPRRLDGEIEHVLVVVRDVSAEVQAQHAEESRQEVMAVFLRLMQDRGSVCDFMSEARRLVSAISAGEGTATQQRRWIHTLKGNCALFGLRGLSAYLHQLETRLSGCDRLCNDDERKGVAHAWSEVEDRLAPILNHRNGDMISVDRGIYETTLALAEDAGGDRRLAQVLRQWSWMPLHPRVTQLGERTAQLAERLQKQVDVQVDVSDDLRLAPSTGWRAFWASMVHVMRNAVDHGVEFPLEREAAGKTPTGTVHIRVRHNGAALLVEVEDDGRGIAWDRVAARAQRLGLPADTHEDLCRALFSDGLTTRAEVTETSGRGVGTAAVLEACESVGGFIEIESQLGQGTCFRFTFPDALVAAA